MPRPKVTVSISVLVEYSPTEIYRTTPDGVVEGYCQDLCGNTWWDRVTDKRELNKLRRLLSKMEIVINGKLAEHIEIKRDTE